MSTRYVIGLDQSTQATKAILLDPAGAIVGRADVPHRQIITDAGWVSHDGEEILRSCVQVINLALPDAPVITGSSREVFDTYGLNAAGIARAAKALQG